MRDLVNLTVELDDERFSGEAATRARDSLTRGGYALEGRRSADDTTLAWIDATFGGWWSSETYASSNLIARRNGQLAGFASFDPHGLDFVWLRGARESKAGVFGPFGVAPEERGGILGATLLQLGLASLRERGFARAVIPAVGDDALIRYYAEHAGARAAERYSSGTVRRTAGARGRDGIGERNKFASRARRCRRATAADPRSRRSCAIIRVPMRSNARGKPA